MPNVMDFSILRDLGNTYNKDVEVARTREQVARRDEALKTAAANAQANGGKLDFNLLAQTMFGAGDLDAATAAIRMAELQSDRDWRRSTDTRDHAFRVQESER